MKRCFDDFCAGEGEVARYMSKLASSSPVRLLATALKPSCLRRADLASAGGGVRGLLIGGEDRIVEDAIWKEWSGRSSSSSSESRGEGASSGTVDVSEMKDSVWPWDMG